MRVTLESTTKIVTVNGVPARVWQGHTAGGVPVHAFITRIAAPAAADLTEFERELEHHEAPRPEVAAIDMRLLVD